MNDLRDLSDDRTRSGAGAACLLNFWEERITRAEADAWNSSTRLEMTPVDLAIDKHFSRVGNHILTRTHE